jgi:hypothetical protein
MCSWYTLPGHLGFLPASQKKKFLGYDGEKGRYSGIFYRGGIIWIPGRSLRLTSKGYTGVNLEE